MTDRGSTSRLKIVRMVNGKRVEVKTTVASGYKLEAAALEKAITPKTAA